MDRELYSNRLLTCSSFVPCAPTLGRRQATRLTAISCTMHKDEPNLMARTQICLAYSHNMHARPTMLASAGTGKACSGLRGVWAQQTLRAIGLGYGENSGHCELSKVQIKIIQDFITASSHKNTHKNMIDDEIECIETMYAIDMVDVLRSNRRDRITAGG